MCCGSKKSSGAGAASVQRASRSSRSNRTVPLAPQLDIIVGAEGMTLLEYQLTKAGPVTYRGAVTAQTYVFGGKYKRGLVDNRDVAALIARIEDRRHAFAYAGLVQADGNELDQRPVVTKSKMETEPMKIETLPEPVMTMATAEPVVPKRKPGRPSKRA